MSKVMYFSPFLISLCFLTLQQPPFLMFMGVNSPTSGDHNKRRYRPKSFQVSPNEWIRCLLLWGG